MDTATQIEKTLNELLIHASKIKESLDDPVGSAQLSDEQKRLLDFLFNQWDLLSEEEKKQIFESKIESKLRQFSKQNQACLKEIHERVPIRKNYSSTPSQPDFLIHP